MSTAPVLSELTEAVTSLHARVQARPLDLVRPVEDVIPEMRGLVPTLLPWQQPLWHLAACDGIWRNDWGPRPSRPPRVIAVVCANQVGKSKVQGGIIARHATGRLPRFPNAGELWGAMPTLADSTAIMRPHVEHWLGTADGAEWRPREASAPTQSVLKTRAGFLLRLKAYEQGVESFESGTLQAAYVDEPVPDDVLSALRTRLTRFDGMLLATFTPLQGVQNALYGETWEPWQAYKLRNPGARWGEVAPGLWVFSVGVMENVRSRHGWLDDGRVANERAALEARGRMLEARVRYDGEWLDISEDRIIPVEKLLPWSLDPKGGWARTAIRIDPAYSAREKSCKTGIALASAGWDGKAYIRISDGGRWDDEERNDRCCKLILENGCPPTYVQRVPGDEEFRKALNRELMRRGGRAVVMPWPAEGEGKVADKVTRAHVFATCVVNGQVYARPEHRELRRQAGIATRESLAKGEDCDVLDAAMGAVEHVTEPDGSRDFVGAMQASGRVMREEAWPSERMGGSIEDGAYGDFMSETE